MTRDGFATRHPEGRSVFSEFRTAQPPQRFHQASFVRAPFVVDGFYSMGKLRFPCCRSRRKFDDSEEEEEQAKKGKKKGRNGYDTARGNPKQSLPLLYDHSRLLKGKARARERRRAKRVKK